MVRPIEWPPIRLSFEEYAMRASDKVLMKVGDPFQWIVGDPKGILDQQLRCQFH